MVNHDDIADVDEFTVRIHGQRLVFTAVDGSGKMFSTTVDGGQLGFNKLRVNVGFRRGNSRFDGPRFYGLEMSVAVVDQHNEMVDYIYVNSNTDHRQTHARVCVAADRLLSILEGL